MKECFLAVVVFGVFWLKKIMLVRMNGYLDIQREINNENMRCFKEQGPSANEKDADFYFHQFLNSLTSCSWSADILYKPGSDNKN